MNNRRFLLFAQFVALIFSGRTLHAAQSLNSGDKPGQIKCVEWADDFDSASLEKHFAQLSIELNNQGRARRIHLTRIAVDTLTPIDVVFDSKSNPFTHQMVPTGANPDTGDCGFDAQGCRTQIEVVTAHDQSGISIEIRLNDHQYGGAAGSSYAFSLGKQKFESRDSDHYLRCDGPLMDPDLKADPTSLEK